jgi:glycosyltransferase involved in cell wall biosynthesis
LNIKLFFRKSTSGFRSIEELFDIVLSSHREIQCDILEMPEKQISPGKLYRNLRFAYTSKGQINHITGDVHYIALATGRNTVLTVHDAYSLLVGSWLKKLVLKLLWFWLPALIVKRITTISEKSRKELEQIIPFAKNKIRVIPNPYNPKLLEHNAHSDGERIFPIPPNLSCCIWVPNLIKTWNVPLRPWRVCRTNCTS